MTARSTKTAAIAIAALSALALAGCGTKDADVVSKNIATAADNFEINRRIVFINNVTGNPIQVIEGWCNAEIEETRITTTCKVPGGYHKHIAGRNATTTFSVQQLDAAGVSKDHYRVTFKPSVVIPDIEVR